MDVRDQVFAVVVMWVRLARKDDLDRPDLAGNLLEPVEILKDQPGSLVGGKPPGESYGQYVAIESRVRLPIHMLD